LDEIVGNGQVANPYY
jgi:hypothetical protein